VNEDPILGTEDGSDLVKKFSTHYDVPAYIRRARRVQEGFDLILGKCRQQRDKWLIMVRIRLGVLRALAGDWERLRPLLTDDDQVHVLRRLHNDLDPRLRSPVEVTSSLRRLRYALRELVDSLERFNRRWQGYLPGVDLTHVNELREGYNRYFVLEKECAVRSVRTAQQGFEKLTPLTTEELTVLLPVLPVPRLKR
jgi:hypothetical protein